jgi:hypothetical protein
MVETHHVCFLGCTERGPLDEPVHVSSPKMFIERFGEPLDGSFLAHAVSAFFQNGGRECAVLRIAHARRRSVEEVAAKSQCLLKTPSGEPLVRVEAESPGAWANGLTVTLSSARKPIAGVLMQDVRTGDTAAELSSAYGLAHGMTLVFDPKDRQPEFRTISGISERTVVWEEPLEFPLVAQQTSLLRLSVKFEVEHNGQRETFGDLALMDEGRQAIVSHVSGQSRLVRVSLPGGPSKFEGSTAGRLSGGADGRSSVTPADYIGSNEEIGYRTGLEALAVRDDVNVIVCPDLYPTAEWGADFGGAAGVTAVWHAVLNHCERHPNRFALIDPPPGLGADKVSEWRAQFDSAFGALYYPWVHLVTGSSELPLGAEDIPPSGPVAGLLSHQDQENGVHHAPANSELYGVVRLAQKTTWKEQELLNPISVNCLRVFPGRGVRPYGARTLSSAADWRYINVRRTASAIVHAVYLGTQWAVFEPNDATLEKKLTRSASAFLVELWRKGFMQGDTPEKSFFVRCDDTTTSKAERDAGQIIVEIGLALAHPAEFIIVRFAQQTMQNPSE